MFGRILKSTAEEIHKTLHVLLLPSHSFFNFKFNMISSAHLISSPSADHVHSLQYLWFQKIYLRSEGGHYPRTP